MISWFLATAVGSWLTAAEPPVSKDGFVSPAATELWVDASSASDGDGTAQRPFKSLDGALRRANASAAHIHLAAGLYQGPFIFGPSAQLEGSGAAVLFAEGSEVVITPRGPLRLSNVIVQGGSVGIENAADVSLSGVAFSGQRSLAVHATSGSLWAERTTFSASVSEARGVKVEPNARALFWRCTFQGPFGRAIELNAPSRVEISDCFFDGPVTGVHQVAGSAAIHRTKFSGGRGPAIYSARGTLELVDVDVHGHEYALQGGANAAIRVLRFSSVRAERAAIAMTRATAQLEEITVVDSGSFGAVQLIASTVGLRRFRLAHPEAYGLFARQSRVSVDDGAITDVADSGGSAGDGIHARGTQGYIQSVSVLRSAGAGLIAAEESSLELRDFAVDGCHWGGVIAESLARVTGSSWTIRRCEAPAIAVPDVAQVDVDVLRSEGNAQGAAWAECDRGGKLRVSRPHGGAIDAKLSSCVEWRQ